MDYVNSSRLTAIVQVDKGTNRQFAVIPLNQYFSSKPKVNSKNPLEVDVKLNTSFSNIVDQYFDTTTSSTAGVNDDATNNSQIYIVQNYYELLNYLTYLIQTNVDASITGSNAESVSVFNYLKQNFNGENTFVDAYDKDHNIKTNDNALLTDSEFNKGDNGYHYYQVSDNGNVLIVNGDAADEGANNFFTDAPLYFESKRNDDSGGK
jgi:hypothetical protein